MIRLCAIRWKETATLEDKRACAEYLTGAGRLIVSAGFNRWIVRKGWEC